VLVAPIAPYTTQDNDRNRPANGASQNSFEFVRPRPRLGKGVALKAMIAACSCAALLAALPGCTYYVAPGTPAPGIANPGAFDRAFSAASAAMRDQGLEITVEDRASGTVIGRHRDGTVTATLRQQADGSVRVQLNSSNTRDPALIDRVSRSYDLRMGR
jgi:hypothetical protein